LVLQGEQDPYFTVPVGWTDHPLADDEEVPNVANGLISARSLLEMCQLVTSVNKKRMHKKV